MQVENTQDVDQGLDTDTNKLSQATADPNSGAQDQEGQEQDDGDTDDSGEQDQGQASASSQQTTEPNKGKAPWFQKRINQLTFEKNEERRLNAELQRKIDALVGQFATLHKGASSSDDEASTDTQQEQPQRQSASRGAKPMTEDQINAMAEARARELAKSMAQQQNMDEALNRVYYTGKNEYPDFDDALKTFGLLGGLPPTIMEMVADMKDSHKVLYQLGKDPDEAERILSLSPNKAALELARFEARASAPVRRAVSSAPAPIKTIDGSSRAPEDPEKMSTDQWIKWREKQLNERRAGR
jgi:hypothetical protein